MADQFLQRFASGLQQFAAQSATPPTFIFFCMNPQEFGMSDLRIAYQLHRQLDDKIDFRVWQGDPDVDGVIHLLRQLDAAICMRFHACIFALTQQLPTIGLDYYPGQGGKVEQLFKDMDRSDEACRMDQMETEWLLDTLHKLLPAISVRKQNRQ